MSERRGKIIDPGHRGDLDTETFGAWGRLVFGGFREKELKPPDLKEIARLLRLGKPIPPFMQDWLADLLDPPRDESYDGFQLILDCDRRAAQKFETKWKDFNKALSIAVAIEGGKSSNEAIDAVMPGRRRQGYAVWKDAQPLLEWLKSNPDVLKSISKLQRSDKFFAKTHH